MHKDEFPKSANANIKGKNDKKEMNSQSIGDLRLHEKNSQNYSNATQHHHMQYAINSNMPPSKLDV